VIEFVVPGEPQGKGRARATRTGRMYTPARTVAYESLVRIAAAAAMGQRSPMDGPVGVQIEATHTIPASWSKKRSQAALLGATRPTGRPDADNILKAIADGGNGVVWRDDKQIVDLSMVKRYGTYAGVLVRAWPVLPKGENHV
jgi:Holliday junction resolvase RusA-like endonuclease